jgi:hypothetical protein
MPSHHRHDSQRPMRCSLAPAIGEARQHALQAKAGADPSPQGRLILETRQGLDALPGRIQQHQRRIAHAMARGKCTPLGRIQIRQDKRHLAAKLWPERVDDALELGTVRSPR